MTKPVTLPTASFNSLSGNEPASLLDANFAALKNAANDLATYSNYQADAGAVNAYSITYSGSLTVNLVAGLMVQFLAANTNTGPATLDVHDAAASGAQPIILRNGNALTGGEIQSGHLSSCQWNGTSWELAAPANFTSQLPRAYISGLLLSNDVGTPNTVMDFSAGTARDSSNTYDLTLASAFTKSQSNWVAGNGNGGKFQAAAIATSTWYYFFAIRKDSDGSIDCGFDTATNAPNIPAGYTAYRLIGAWPTDGSGNWQTATTYETEGGGMEVQWSVPALEVNILNTLTTSRRLDTIRVPTAFSVMAHIRIEASDAGAAFVLNVCNPAETDAAPSSSAAPLGIGTFQVANADTRDLWLRTSSSGQIASRATIATVDSYRVATVGYVWGRRS